jgi:hypothetical protein
MLCVHSLDLGPIKLYVDQPVLAQVCGGLSTDHIDFVVAFIFLVPDFHFHLAHCFKRLSGVGVESQCRFLQTCGERAFRVAWEIRVTAAPVSTSILRGFPLTSKTAI